MELSGPVKSELRQRAASILEDIITLPGNKKPGRKGVYLRVFDTKAGIQLDKAVVGDVPKDKFRRYKDSSRENAKHLLGHPKYLSSFDSLLEKMDRWLGAVRIRQKIIFAIAEKMDRWLGAVRIRQKIISISGLTWGGNEALALQLGIEMGWLDRASAFKIAELSNNELFQELYHKRNERNYKPGGRT